MPPPRRGSEDTILCPFDEAGRAGSREHGPVTRSFMTGFDRNCVVKSSRRRPARTKTW